MTYAFWRGLNSWHSNWLSLMLPVGHGGWLTSASAGFSINSLFCFVSITPLQPSFYQSDFVLAILSLHNWYNQNKSCASFIDNFCFSPPFLKFPFSVNMASFKILVYCFCNFVSVSVHFLALVLCFSRCKCCTYSLVLHFCSQMTYSFGPMHLLSL